ncbi:serine hydrolase [Actinoplanes sp. M2I2]|uniref:serine hydrolase domain-containing protein n=1 Tax=Actinoplanes sp. M2I2 TaxID=1734444 RepID=UPI0020202245|nr:serine hydrolase domain-containing protein [Actinoplanes sp. M2I2]
MVNAGQHDFALEERVAALVEQAGYGPDDPLVVGVRPGGGPPAFLARGRDAAGNALTTGAVVCTASVSKQITAACAALLVRRGRLDTRDSLARWMPELPAWAGAVEVRHLIHHTSGLPEGVEFDDLHRAGVDRTTARVLEAITGRDHPDAAPGIRYRYSNAGYICLAVVVERAAGRPLPDFAREHVFQPLGMADSRYWSGPAPHPPAATPTDPRYPAALSLGDGGVWSTARDLLRWNTSLDRDELGIAGLVHTPGRLDDGTELDYAWALDVRTHRGCRVYRHGGLWAGLSIQLVRIADRQAGFVVAALDIEEERTGRLADALIEELTA